ncbi:DUF6545 domain-containing protein [Nonomuraea dietziae]|uniref:DUF6545 domain-containing protein n=1 Tax=Nonomuraea dietziae TaxID=65515 RepID=UPI0033F6BD52
MWVVAIFFSLGVRGSRAFKSVWLAVFSGVTSMSIGWTSLGTWLHEVSGSGTTALVAEHVLALVAMASMSSWVCWSFVEDVGDLTWRRWVRPIWLAATLVGCSLAALAFANDLNIGVYDTVGAQQASPAQLLYLALYELSMMAVMYAEVVVFVRRVRVVPAHQNWLRRCIYSLAISAFLSSARSVYTMIYLAPQVLGFPPLSLPWSTAFALYVNVAPYTFGFLCLLLPKLDRRRSPEQDLAEITALWQDLMAAFPHLVRVGTADTPSAELMARSALTGEALVRLQKFTPADLWHQARAFAADHAREREQEAVAYAAWIRSALDYLAEHPSPRGQNPTWRLSARAGTPNWVFAVAREYNRATTPRRLWQRRSAAARFLTSQGAAA